jgi:hypothetical protein
MLVARYRACSPSLFKIRLLLLLLTVVSYAVNLNLLSCFVRITLRLLALAPFIEFLRDVAHKSSAPDLNEDLRCLIFSTPFGEVLTTMVAPVKISVKAGPSRSRKNT